MYEIFVKETLYENYTCINVQNVVSFYTGFGGTYHGEFLANSHGHTAKKIYFHTYNLYSTEK